MKNPLLLLVVAILCLFSACSDKEVPASITLTGSSSTINLAAGKNQPVEVTFTSTRSWTAASQATWITISPKQGEAGEACTISIYANSSNEQANERIGYVTIAIDNSVSQQITVIQSEQEFVTPEKTYYSIPAEGMERLDIKFTTNIEEGSNLWFGYTEGLGDWVHLYSEGTKATRSTLTSYRLSLTIDENPTHMPRGGYIVFYTKDEDGNQNYLADVQLLQEGNGDLPSSTDYSADKQVKTLQTHTLGNGVPLVFTGDGFMDTDIASGWYDQCVSRAIEHLFSEEPLRSLTEYFDIYSVTAVSKNNLIGQEYSTAFSSYFEGLTSSGIYCETDSVLNYVKLVPNINWKETSAILLINCTDYGGTTSMGYVSGGMLTNFSVCMCPIIGGIDSEIFGEVLLHEGIGHGFAKLDDEYGATYSNGTIPDSEITYIQNYQKKYSWFMNVDVTNNPSTVLWQPFLSDKRFEGQGLGIYEGGATYTSGVYRPTEQSIMNENIEHFNAPSRQQIYNRVMKLGLGTEPTYEEFVAFDMAHPYNATTKSASSSTSVKLKGHPFGRPFISHSKK